MGFCPGHPCRDGEADEGKGLEGLGAADGRQGGGARPQVPVWPQAATVPGGRRHQVGFLVLTL